MLFVWILSAASVVFTVFNVGRSWRSRRTKSANSIEADHNQRFTLIVHVVSLSGPCYAVLSRGDERVISAALVSLTVSLVWFFLNTPLFWTRVPAPVNTNTDKIADAVPQSLNRAFSHRLGLSVVAGKTGLLLALGTALAAFYFATQTVIARNSLALRDRALLEVDEMLLGWLFPRGQLALWLDQSAWLGPKSIPGRLMVDLLTVWYVLYYAWAYVVLAALLVRAIWIERRKSPQHEAAAWRAAEAFMCAWIWSFILTFAVNTLCPAVSPRIYLRSEFKNPLDGFGLVRAFWGPVIHQDNTYGSFPSGHVGETLVVGVAALKLGVTPKLDRLVLVASGLVAVATVWLRYHYFIDVVASIAIAYVAVQLSGCSPSVACVPKASSSAAQEAALSYSADVEKGLASHTPPSARHILERKSSALFSHV